MFEPGEKVVCVNDSFQRDIRDYYNALPVKGKTYTVRDIVPALQFSMKETAGVLLEELVNLPNEHGLEPTFLCFRFVSMETIDDEMINKEELVEVL